MTAINPSQQLERTIIDIQTIFEGTNTPHWLMFGALWGLIVGHGSVPDGDFDMCTYYGQDWRPIAKAAESEGYTIKKIMLDDTDQSKALYMGFFKGEIYICLSFWYPFDKYRFWCHDQLQDVKSGAGVPSQYFFKGCPAWMVEGDRFFKSEWPGVDQRYTIRVPTFAGSLLDLSYRNWAYFKQRYVIQNYQPEFDKMISVNDPVYNRKNPDVHANSPYKINVKSMSEFRDVGKINSQLKTSEDAWNQRTQ
jgi:hypothetical protein